jgi:hypothetical protein
VNTELPLNVLIIGRTGAGKSAIINKLCGQKAAKSGNDVKGVTKETTRYKFTLTHPLDVAVDPPGQKSVKPLKREVVLVDTSGIGDPTTSFEDTVATLMMPETGTLGEVFDVVLVCEKDTDRCEPPVRKALQVLDVTTEQSGHKPWGNVILVGTQADRWNTDDEDGEEADPVANFRTQFIPQLVELAKTDGATGCSLPNAVAVSTRKTAVASMDTLAKMLVSWPSHIETGEGVEMCAFDPKKLEMRYANIAGSENMGMADGFRVLMLENMKAQEMAVAYEMVLKSHRAWKGHADRLVTTFLPTHIDNLDELAENADAEKQDIVVGKSIAAGLATASAIMVWFPPTTVLGVICGISAGATSLTSTVVDCNNEQNRKGSLGEAMKTCLTELKNFDYLTKMLVQSIQKYAQRYAANYTQTQSEATSNANEGVAVLELIGGAAGLGGHIFGGISYAVVAGSVEAAEAGSRVAATALGGSLAVVGGVLAIVDLAYTADQEPAHQSKLREASEALTKEKARVARVDNQIQEIMAPLMANHARLPRNSKVQLYCNVVDV